MELINLTDAPDQVFSLVVGLRRITVRVYWHSVPGQWLMDLSIDDEPLVQGRPLRLNRLTLRPFKLGIGDFLLTDASTGSLPNRETLARGDVRMVWVSEEEINAAIPA